MLLNDIVLRNLISLKTILLDVLGPEIVSGIHQAVKATHKFMLMKVTHRHGRIYPVWEVALMCVFAQLVSLASWRSAQKIRARMKRTKESQQMKLQERKILQATAVMMNGNQKIIAVAECLINSYSLKLTMQGPKNAIFETGHQFQTIDDLAKFLEEKTILRLADFKPI